MYTHSLYALKESVQQGAIAGVTDSLAPRQLLPGK